MNRLSSFAKWMTKAFDYYFVVGALVTIWLFIIITPLVFLTPIDIHGECFRFFIARDIVGGIVMSILVVIIKRWHHHRTCKHQLQLITKEAELQNMKKEISPHFLLNTLNNIYALIAFDKKRAQEAVIDLSNMLRTLLYSDTSLPVPLSQAVSFMQDYVKLMKLRLSSHVKIKVDVNLPSTSDHDILVAPMLIVPLVENAFKHGIHSIKESFISIKIQADTQHILIEVANSYHPKSEADKSGHGIGLKQLKTRLDLIYPGKYEWIKGTNEDATVYTSKIILYDTKLCNHR